MAGRLRKFHSRMDRISSTFTQRWSKRARATNILAIFVIFYRTKNGVTQLVYSFDKIRGEFSERYRDHMGRYKKNAALKGLSKRALQERAFEESTAYVRGAIDMKGNKLQVDDNYAMETHLTVLGMHLLKVDPASQKSLPKKGGVLAVYITYHDNELGYSFADVFNPQGGDPFTPFESFIDNLLFVIPAVYSGMYDIKGFDADTIFT